MLLPLMQFHFDTSWPSPDAGDVFMTAMKVWGPLSITLLAAVLFAPNWIVIPALLWAGFFWWVDPAWAKSISWKEDTNG